MSFRKYQKVRIHFPGDRYDGEAGTIIQIDPNDRLRLTYLVQLDNKQVNPDRIPIWLPEKRLRKYSIKTLNDLEYGDEVVNPAGLEFEIVEPVQKVYFIRLKNNPHIIQYVTVEEMQVNGFTIKNKEANHAGGEPQTQVASA